MNEAKSRSNPEDRAAIEEVLAIYCIALDEMDLDRLAALFTADCRVDYGPDARLQSNGAADLRQSLERMWRWRRTSHHLSNVTIDFEDADTANVVSYVLAWHERPDLTSATVYGRYVDRFVRTTEGWRIAKRRMLMNGSDRAFTVDINPLERREAPAGWTAPDIDR